MIHLTRQVVCMWRNYLMETIIISWRMYKISLGGSKKHSKHTMVHLWRSGDNFVELVLFFDLHVGSRDQDVRLVQQMPLP